MKQVCLSFNQMYELLSCEQFTAENRARLNSHNKHLLSCSQCQDTYKQLYDLNTVLQQWNMKNHVVVEHKIKYLRSALAIIQAQQKSAPQMISRIDQWLQNNFECREVMTVRINEHLDVIQDIGKWPNKMPAFDYTGPLLETDKDEITDSFSPSDSKEINTVQSMVFQEGRSLHITVPAKPNISPPLVALIPANFSGDARLFELASKPGENVWELTIDNVAEGEYGLLIECAR